MAFEPTAEQTHLNEELHDVYSDVLPVVKETKAGYKTTEFWLTAAGVVLLNLNAIPLPDKWQGVVSLAAIAAYNIARGIAKQGVPDVVEAKKV
jgi:hypothetical protein